MKLKEPKFINAVNLVENLVWYSIGDSNSIREFVGSSVMDYIRDSVMDSIWYSVEGFMRNYKL